MEIKLLSCPICLKPNFEGVDVLRSSLIRAATAHISCPVCNELLMGLDKLTIHLFSHVTGTIVHENLPETVTLIQSKESEHHHVEPHVRIDKNTLESNQVEEDERQVQVLVEKEVWNSEPKEKSENICIEGGNLTHENGEKRNCLKCDICNFCFWDENILEMHQKLLHQTQTDEVTGVSSYHCHLCSKKFKMRGSLMVHLRVAHYGFGRAESCHSNCAKKDDEPQQEIADKKAEDVGRISAQLIMEPHKTSRGQENKQWECDVCSKLFTTKYFLKKHKRLHTGEMPYFCAECNKSFTFQQSYHKHILYHSSDKPHVCAECGRAFKELSTLHNHERIHSGERPFACETCGKCFRQRVSYLVHKRIHTGVMPYKCTACDKSFRYKVSQKSHKCSVSPPGSVIRAPHFVNKLLHKENREKTECDGEANAGRETNFKEELRYSEDGQRKENLYQVLANVLNIEYPTCGDSSQQQKHDQILLITNNEESKYVDVSSLVLSSSSSLLTHNVVYSEEGMMSVKDDFKQGRGNFESIVGKTCVEEHNGNTISEANAKESDQLSMDNKNLDFFSLVLSPALPDVRSLCLSDDISEVVSKKCLETINEESFKKLLYGPSD